MVVFTLDELKVGEPFLHASNTPEYDTVTLERINNPNTMCLMAWFENLTREEIEDVMLEEIQTRIVRHEDMILTLFKIERADWYFEYAFDPTLCTDPNFLETFRLNLIMPLVLLERRSDFAPAGKIEGIRLIKLPKELSAAYNEAWRSALKSPNYSGRYTTWLKTLGDAQSLWNSAAPMGTIEP